MIINNNDNNFDNNKIKNPLCILVDLLFYIKVYVKY